MKIQIRNILQMPFFMKHFRSQLIKTNLYQSIDDLITCISQSGSAKHSTTTALKHIQDKPDDPNFIYNIVWQGDF